MVANGGSKATVKPTAALGAPDAGKNRVNGSPKASGKVPIAQKPLGGMKASATVRAATNGVLSAALGAPDAGKGHVNGKALPTIRHVPSNGKALPAGASGRQPVLTRRHFLYGALGAGALIGVGGATMLATRALGKSSSEEQVSYLEVPEAAVFTLENCTELLPVSDFLMLVGSFELPYGTLIWANSDKIAACLFPTETSAPLTSLGALNLDNGDYTFVLESAVGTQDGFEVYDARASEKGFIWIEANIFAGIWRVFTAPYEGGVLGSPIQVDEGREDDWETPSIAAVGSHAFWQVLPALNGPYVTDESVVKHIAFNSTEAAEAKAFLWSQGRMSTPIYPLDDAIVVTPRTPTDAVHHRLCLVDAETLTIKDNLVLPQGMKPLEAGYGPVGFSFSFDGIYGYGGGISNLGTYTPQSMQGSYDTRVWFRFNKTPSAAPAWCGNYLIVKSTRSVCGVSLATRSYFAIDVESGSDTYGDYLATSGSHGSFVTYANIDTKSIDGARRRCCLVRVWTPNPLP